MQFWFIFWDAPIQKGCLLKWLEKNTNKNSYFLFVFFKLLLDHIGHTVYVDAVYGLLLPTK